MGFGLPAAIAAGLSCPQRQIVCLTGDAGLAMVSGELGVLARMNAPIIVVVFNDAALDLIRAQQIRAGKPVFGTEFTNPDLSALAEAYGIAARRITSEAECDEVFQQAILRDSPILVQAMIDPASYPTTPRSVPREGAT
jgi:thiamine pyrophosphate-dependent acetolactate synthase large subunit-like protein